MVRRVKVPTKQPVEEGQTLQTTNANQGPVDEIDGDAPKPEMQEVTKKYADRPNPHPHLSASWQDYKITLQEDWKDMKAQFKFGDGSRDDQPQAFEEIKSVLKNAGYRWDGHAKAWSKQMQFKLDPLSQEQNRRARQEAEELLFPEVLKLEEAARGPATGFTTKKTEQAR